MALIISIELNNATFEDLATLVSTAGAAGADESTTIEIDDEQQVLRVIIEDPIAPDIDTSDPTFFTFFDNDTDDDEDFGEDFDEGFDLSFDDSRNFEGFGPDYGRDAGRPKPFDISTAINDFIDNLKDELPFGPSRGNNPERYESDWKNPNKFPPADFLYGLAEDYFRDFGYRGKNRGDFRGNFRGEDRGGQHRDDPIQDDFYTDEPRFEDFWGKKNPFGSAGGGDFSELRNAGEGFFRGLSDFINEQVDRRTENGGGRGGRHGRGPVNGYGSFTNPGADDDHPEGTARDDQDTEEKLNGFRDFPGQGFSDDEFSGFDYLDEDDIEDQARRADDGEYSQGDSNPGNSNRGDDNPRDEKPGDGNTDDENES